MFQIGYHTDITTFKSDKTYFLRFIIISNWTYSNWKTLQVAFVANTAIDSVEMAVDILVQGFSDWSADCPDAPWFVDLLGIFEVRVPTQSNTYVFFIGFCPMSLNSKF